MLGVQDFDLRDPSLGPGRLRVVTSVSFPGIGVTRGHTGTDVSPLLLTGPDPTRNSPVSLDTDSHPWSGPVGPGTIR